MEQLRKVLRLSAAALAGLTIAGTAQAYEYPLQYILYGNYENLVVAGYQIVGTTVVGNCSYTRITSGSGRDPHSTDTPIPQTCSWDLYGNLISTVAGAPTVPTPIATSGTETIYARPTAKLYTGTDSALHNGGFVFKYGSHYQWVTPAVYEVLSRQAPYSFTATISSNGDTALIVSTVKASALLGKVTLDTTTCIGTVAVGATCDVSVTYDDTKFSSVTGLAYDTLTIHLKTTAGQSHDFVQSYTDVVRIPPDCCAP